MTDLHAAAAEYLAALDVNRKLVVPEYGKTGGRGHEDISRQRAVRLFEAEKALRAAVGDA